MEYPDWSELSDVEGEVADHYRALKAENERWRSEIKKQIVLRVAAEDACMAHQAENERLNKEKEAAWDSAEYNARRAEAAEKENERLRSQNKRLRAAITKADVYMTHENQKVWDDFIAEWLEEEPSSSWAAIDAAMKGGE